MGDKRTESQRLRRRISSRQKGPLAPCPELWTALEEGVLLRRLLEDFYTRVFADERLAPFFIHVTKQRVVGKQFEFLRDIVTGSRDYFGLEPRNAHHWMVISDELFDYREDLLATVLRDHGLAEEHVARIRSIDEVYRKQIVKATPVPMISDGVQYPLEGYDRVEACVGSLCDGCGQEIAIGDTAYCHVRTGKGYCEPCGCKLVSQTPTG